METSEYQVTSWRDLPSLVVVRPAGGQTGEQQVKVPLASRFQEAIDEAAMRLGAVGSDAYLEGWQRGGWTPADGDLEAVADRVVAELDAQWSEQAVTDYLDALGPAGSDA